MDISESGNLLITGSDDRTARVWDLLNSDLKVMKITPHSSNELDRLYRYRLRQ